METGAFGWGFEDQIRPVLDEYDRRINNVLANGVYGDLARAQAVNDALAGGGQTPMAGAPDMVDIGMMPPPGGADGHMRNAGFRDDAGFSNLVGSPNVQQLGPEGLTNAGLVNHSAYSEPSTRKGSSSQVSDQTAGGVTVDREWGNKAAGALNAELTKQNVLSTVYPDFNKALGAWADVAQPFQQKYDTELNSQIHAVPGGWQIGTASSNGSRCFGGAKPCDTYPAFSGDVPGGQYWGFIHTHPSNAVPLDWSDAASGFDPSGIGNGVYVSLPNGQINGWNKGMSKEADLAHPENPAIIYQYTIRKPQR